MIHFITGNTNKFKEYQTLIPDIEQLDIDLPEIQELDPKKIISYKLQSAFTHHSGPFVVEDVSFYLAGLNGLPGPLIKWFLQSLGNDGLVDLTKKLNNNKATIKAIIGYAEDRDHVHFFEGSMSCQVVPPLGANGFGWDPIILLDGHTQTIAQMSPAEKNQFSMRGLAIKKLKDFLNNQKQN